LPHFISNSGVSGARRFPGSGHCTYFDQSPRRIVAMALWQKRRLRVKARKRRRKVAARCSMTDESAAKIGLFHALLPSLDPIPSCGPGNNKSS
jgi:hypothetical protein